MIKRRKNSKEKNREGGGKSPYLGASFLPFLPLYFNEGRQGEGGGLQGGAFFFLAKFWIIWNLISQKKKIVLKILISQPEIW